MRTMSFRTFSLRGLGLRAIGGVSTSSGWVRQTVTVTVWTRQ